MSGYRVMAGVGVIDRSSFAKNQPDSIGDLPVYSANSTDCLHQLTNRIGAGVTMSVSRTRNNNYVQEMGLREFTTATSGLEEVDVSFSGIFSPKLCEKWLGYGFMMGDGNAVDDVFIDSNSEITCYSDPAFETVVASPSVTDTVYIKITNGSGSTYTWSKKTPTSKTSAPTKTTSGAVGDLISYNNKIYVCSDAETDYNWVTKTISTATAVPDKDVKGDLGDVISCDSKYYVCTGVTSGFTWTQKDAATTTPTKTTKGTLYDLAVVSGTAYVLMDVPEYVWSIASVKDATATPGSTTKGDIYDVLKYNSEYYVCTAVAKSEVEFGQPMLYEDVSRYRSFVSSTGAKVKLFGYKNLTGPKYFDIGYQKINQHASGVSMYDGLNEMGVLVGCIIDSFAISYESGSDAAVKFQMSVHALRDIEYVTTSQFDYSAILDEVPTDVFVGGCVSVFDADATTPAYEAVAQTDSASFSVGNSTQKLGNCLKLNYSSYAIGALSYDVSTSTYSNDPNKYLKYFYGYNSMDDGQTYFIGKAPKAIAHMKIRTDDTSAVVSSAKMFMDINLTDTYVGDMSNAYDVGSAIMDEPSLRTKKAYIAVGYTG